MYKPLSVVGSFFKSIIAREPLLNKMRRTYAASNVAPNCVRAKEHKHRVALTDYSSTYTYGELLDSSELLAREVGRLCGRRVQNRVAFLCPNDASYVVTQWATWMSGNVAVPLHKSHPPPQLEYYIEDSRSALIVTTPDLKHKVEGIATSRNIPLLVIGNTKPALTFREFEKSDGALVDDQFYNTTDALIIYTSGTTGPPKGVLLTHANLQSQVEVIAKALHFSSDDCVLHVLPLHHTHGIVHALLSPLHVGASLMMLPQFTTEEVWNKLLSPHSERVNVMLAVPTMYIKLLEEASSRNVPDADVRSICKTKMRLMVSGSSALPEPIFERWENLTGHRILERYGMTEIGLALTNSMFGERRPGFVGNPMGCVEVCIARENTSSPNGYDVIATGTEQGTKVFAGREDEAGELYIRGPNVFKEYFNKPEATKKTFSSDGWFKTGDTISYRDGMYKIEGRTSVDIIKSGGYKISALDVERHLLSHPNIADVSVVGVPDPTWGQRVAAVVVTRNKGELLLPDLREWCKQKMAPYTVPTVLQVVKQLPKNAVGKVNKKDLVRKLFPDSLKSSKL